MPKRSTVLELVEQGLDYQEAGTRLGIHPGQAYMIATGIPADGSDVPAPEDMGRPGLLPGSTQHLANPAPLLRKTESQVEGWMSRSAAADPQMLQAAALRPPGKSTSPGEDTQRRRTEEGDEGEQGEGEQGEGEGEGEQAEGEQGGPDVVHLLRHQHNEARALLKELEALPALPDATPADLRRKQWTVELLVPALSSHETAEQELFWPAVRDMVEGGPALADRALEQERKASSILSRLDGLAPDDEDFDQLVEELVSSVRQHVALEDAVLRRLEASLEEEQRRDLGGRLQRATRHGPTRAHPHAPTNPAAVRVVRPVAAAADRARDRVAGRRRRAGRQVAEKEEGR